ncbi:unnamed protein product [Rotaria sordida]|uniref:Kinesin light chain n=2 Tax=Rotaria sordida TaxID=392033 RepID=A0A819CVS9_9BILA|nr:unnamed protein product [Rotaria sordida]
MSLLKCCTIRRKRAVKNLYDEKNIDNNVDTQRENEEEAGKYEDHDANDENENDGTKLIYFACETPKQHTIDILRSIRSTLETFTVEKECIDYMTLITDKIFLVIDGLPSTSFIAAIEPLKQIDSVFFYSPTSSSIDDISKQQYSYLVYLCETEETLIDSIRKSREELDKHIAALSIYNKKDKATRDLSKEDSSLLFFELFKNLLKNMPKTSEAKNTMVTTCRNYYRGNLTELANIDEFDQTYKSTDAIPWYMKDTFINKFINKALRTEDVSVLYQFRFYIMDLSEQLEMKFLELKKKQKDVLRLYRYSQLNFNEVKNFQRNIGNLISTNEYLLTSNQRSAACDFAIKSPKRDDFERVLFEYQVDLNIVQTIVIADVREYSTFPEQVEFLVDIGAVFQIDSCQYNVEEDLWHVQVHATDQNADLAAEYVEYQAKKMAESNIILMFGDLLLEMGEYAKAESYFDTILNSSNPNDEEIACIFFNFGRTHQLKGDFNRAINCYNRAYNLHMSAQPKRLASAGKTLNGLGIVYNEQGRQIKAEECFQRAMKLYKKSIPKKHVNVAATLINLGTIDCDRQHYDEAIVKYRKAKKIYDSSLPSCHPNHAIIRVNLGNVYLASRDYSKACEEYEIALKLQQQTLLNDHPYIARTLHNLAVVQTHLGNIEQAKQYLERAEEIAGHTLSSKHPVVSSIRKTKALMAEEN